MKLLRVATLAVCGIFAGVALAQNPPASGTAAAPGGTSDPTAATTGLSTPPGTMSKADLKRQRNQQKLDEAAAKAVTKAAQAAEKAKIANDKALQAQEKAGQVRAGTPAPAAK